MSNTSNIFTQNMAGTVDEEVILNKSLYRTQVTVIGVLSGTLTVKAKADGDTVFKDVEGGLIDLSLYGSVIIDNSSLQSIAVTNSNAVAYDLRITQTKLEIYA